MFGYGFLGFVTLFSLGLQIYHYVLYPGILWLLLKLRRRKPRPVGGDALSVSLIVSAYNEEGIIGAKLDNCFQLHPAPSEILVVADGSDDQTVTIAKKWQGREIAVKILYSGERKGKSAAMNRGADQATGDILLFSDANALYEANSLRAITDEFAAPDVAVVSGAKKVVAAGHGDVRTLIGTSDGLYWRYEAFIRQCESDLGATVASVGEMLALRRSLWRPIPPGTVNDDAWITMTNLSRGHAARFAPQAISIEQASPTQAFESTRRRRINAGRLKLLGNAGVWPWRRPAVLAAFVSHKVLRLVLPFLMIAGLLANALMLARYDAGAVFKVTMALQIAGLFLILLGYIAARLGKAWRLPHLAYHVFQGNLAALLAAWDVARGKSFVIWEKPAR